MDRRIKYGIIVTAFGWLLTGASWAQQSRSVLFVNGTAHLGNGKVIEKSAIGIEHGKIKQILNARVVDPALLKYDTVINLEGKHLYPGIIAPNSILGLTEIDAVRASRDFSEVGEINPNVRALVAYNAESNITATVRSNGILLAQITPRGGLIPGTSSIVQLEGWNWEDAAYRTDDGIHLNWPRPVNERNEKAEELEKNRNEQLLRLGQFFDAANAYRKAAYQYEKNLRFEAMKELFEGKKTLFIHVDLVKEITEAIYFVRRYNLNKVVIVGGYDAWRVPELIKDNHISVIYRRVHSLPLRQDDATDLPYRIPFLMKQAGIPFCLDASGDMEAMQARNLPFNAGTAAAYGLGKEEALRAVTLDAAVILGIDRTTGSLEEGKDATLFISTGDALEIRGNNVEMAFIKGEAIDLDNRQKELYRKYSEKYE